MRDGKDSDSVLLLTIIAGVSWFAVIVCVLGACRAAGRADKRRKADAR